MFKNYGLDKEEIAEIAISKSLITRWAQRFFVIGVIFAALQGAIFYGIGETYKKNAKLDADITKEHSNITRKLASIGALESKAKKVLDYRKQLSSSFMPMGIYYALAEAVLPGMVFKDIILEKGHIAKGERKELPDDIRNADYILTLSVGYDTPSMDLAPFVSKIDDALSRIYRGNVTRVGLHMQAGQVRAVKDALFTGQEITIGFMTKDGGKK